MTAVKNWVKVVRFGKYANVHLLAVLYEIAVKIFLDQFDYIP